MRGRLARASGGDSPRVATIILSASVKSFRLHHLTD
jgi:hypothetical protein